jgi:Stealth protein CR2, conserved region 2/Stealth protein CR3, conserved region 3
VNPILILTLIYFSSFFFRLEWVDQNIIIPIELQPVFTSNIIEQYLYRIPGLTERFIHLNDDYMIDRAISPSDLYTSEGGAKFFYSRTNVNDDPRPRTGIWFRSLLNTVDAIERAYGTSKGQTRFLKHAPYVYYKSAMEGVHKRFKDVLEVTSHHKFRHEKDVLLPYLHHAYVINEGSRCCSLKYEIVPWKKTSKDSTLLIWTDEVENNVFSIDNIGNPLFLTINDSMGRGKPVAAELQIRQFYKSRYGHLHSPYEKEHLRI